MPPAKRTLKKATSTGRALHESDVDETDEDELETLDDDQTDLNGPEDDDEQVPEPPHTGTNDPDPDTPPQFRTMADSDDEGPIPGAPRDGRTVRAGKPIVFKGEKRGGTIVSLESVYRATQHPTSSRIRFHQILVRGSEIPSSKVRELKDDEFESDQL